MIEPAYVAIAILIGVPMHMLVGGLLARVHYRKILSISDEVLASPDATDDDRYWVKDNMREAGGRGLVWLVALTAPLWSIPALASAVADVMRHRGISDDETLRQSRKQYEELSEKLEAQGVPRYKPAQHSQLYVDKHFELTDATFNAMILKAPLLSLWIGLWFLPAFLAFALSGASSVAVDRARLMFEAAYRRAEAMLSRVAF